MGDLTVHAEARPATRKPRTAMATAAHPRRRNPGGNKKNGPRGPRKSLKRLDSDMEIKVNSKENPSVFQAFPTIFQRFSKQIKGFPKNAKPYAAAKPGVKGAPSSRAAPGSSPGGSDPGTSGAPHVLLDRHAAKARLKRRASLDALWRLARPAIFHAFGRNATQNSGFVSRRGPPMRSMQ